MHWNRQQLTRDHSPWLERVVLLVTYVMHALTMLHSHALRKKHTQALPSGGPGHQPLHRASHVPALLPRLSRPHMPRRQPGCRHAPGVSAFICLIAWLSIACWWHTPDFDIPHAGPGLLHCGHQQMDASALAHLLQHAIHKGCAKPNPRDLLLRFTAGAGPPKFSMWV